MTKAELGTKHTCPNCGAKYYDLRRTPIVCPRCGTPFEAPSPRARPPAAAKVVPVAVAEEEVVVEKAEIVSLEEADEEAAESGKVKVGADGDDNEEEENEAEEDVTFLEEEDEDEDVEQIIGDVDDEER